MTLQVPKVEQTRLLSKKVFLKVSAVGCKEATHTGNDSCQPDAKRSEVGFAG